MKMEQKAAVKAVTCRKIKETDKNRLNPVKLCHQNLCQNFEVAGLVEPLLGPPLFLGEDHHFCRLFLRSARSNCSKLLQDSGRIGCLIGFATLVESNE